MNRAPLALVLVVAVAATLLVATTHADARGRPDTATARAATAGFHHLDHARDAGYGPFMEGVPLHECISGPGDGAMGVHWINGELVADAVLDVARPEALVYEPGPNGELRLVAVEYVVFAAAWEAAHPGTTPTLFGRQLTFHGDDNPYDIPAFWELHAWVFKHNPDGIHAGFNPKASCEHSG